MIKIITIPNYINVYYIQLKVYRPIYTLLLNLKSTQIICRYIILTLHCYNPKSAWL